MRLAGYTIKEVIYVVQETAIARAESDSGERVVLKYQQTRHPSPDLYARWQHEHAVLQSIRSKWVIRSLALCQVENSLVLVLEDFGTSNLAQLISQQNLDLADRLALAVQMVSAISAVHEHHLIHGDISPKNVLVDIAALRLKLCDFGLSSRLDHNQKPSNELLPRGTLEYMSPEQTGRTNLDVDYRSDFYSLGVTLYELFAGRTPFQSNDAMSLLHAQIAIMPTPLHLLDQAIPETLSRIVQKLLAKSPDDRYQSSFGLHSDLSECANQWHRCGRIDNMPLARHDIPERFCVSNKLYGRETERAAIMAAFARVSNGRTELQLISGYSGIGKTALVGELHRPIVAQRGYLVRGKCDQFARNQPFSALIQGFEQLLHQLAAEGEQRRVYWKSALLDALGQNAAAVCDIIPSLALLIGTPPASPSLPPAENESRFHIAFAQFIKALSSRAHPLVLFLDDLQWADAPTLKLIEHLMRLDAELYMLIVGAYRDNEVDDHHPLVTMTNALQVARRPLQQLRLRDLALPEVSSLIADTLHSSNEEVASLAALCLQKTRGNPFFLGQFLRAMVHSGDIHYVRKEGCWKWNVAEIQKRGMTDNVVELMLQKLRELKSETQTLLTLAAHLGESFDMRQLMAVGGRDAAATAAVLWPALKAGMVVPLDENYKFSLNDALLQTARYRFMHDRVQQAAYDLTADDQRLALRLRCGRLLLAGSSDAELQRRLFTILEHLNSAIGLITDAAERAQLLEMNIRGGMRAKSASAMPTAVGLLRCAKAMLDANAWQNAPGQTLLLYKELAEAEYLAGNFNEAEHLCSEGIAATGDANAKVTLSLVQADQYAIQGRYLESTPVLLFALSLLDCDFPSTDALAGEQFVQEFTRTEQLLDQTTYAQLLAAPEMTAAKSLLEMRIYFALSYATYQTGCFNAFVMVACRMVQTTLTQGQCDLSCIGYVAYVTAMSAIGKPYALCYRMGKLALTLAESRENKYFRITVYHYFTAFYLHWCEPQSNALSYLEKGFELGKAGINPLSSGYCAFAIALCKFNQGSPLDELEVDCERALKFLQYTRQPNTLNDLRYGVLLPLQALRTSKQDASSGASGPSAEEFFNGDYTSPSIALAFHSSAMIRHAYLLGDSSAWMRHSANLGVVSACIPDGPSSVEIRFYTALGLLNPDFADADAPAGTGAERQQSAREHIDCFQRWSEDCVENFLHKYLLLAAEAARVDGDDKAAMDLYARAIDAASAADYSVCEALANELYARFWQAQNQPQLASNFIREAFFHYRRWGALAKCRQLEQQWPDIGFHEAVHRSLSGGRSANLRSVSESTALLDLQSLLKANQLLAKEIQLDSLLEKMLEVLLENAGAGQGAIILVDDEQLVVEAAGGLNEHGQVHCQRISKNLADYVEDDQPLLPTAIIEYAQLTRIALVLDNPGADERFALSPYLLKNNPKSVICLPVVTQGKLVALVYLENNELQRAFTAKQQLTLELLSGQAAISLVNARLYESLERKVSQRTEELRQMSLKDGLTGIANRRSFDERLAVEWRRSLHNHQPLSLLMLDIDFFKQYNDCYGHVEGDRCITQVAQLMQSMATRSSELVARYGGEEFAWLLPGTDAGRALEMARSALEELAKLAIPHAGSAIGPLVSASIGIHTQVGNEEGSVSNFIDSADRALYYAKQHGRAQFRHFSELPE